MRDSTYEPLDAGLRMNRSAALFHLQHLQLAPEGVLEIVSAHTDAMVEVWGEHTYCMRCGGELNEKGEGHALDCTTIRARLMINEWPILLARYQASRKMEGVDIDAIHARRAAPAVARRPVRPSILNRINQAITGAVGWVAFVLYLGFLLLLYAGHLCAHFMRTRKKEVTLVAAGAAAGALCMAVAGLAFLLGQSLPQAALTLAYLPFMHGSWI